MHNPLLSILLGEDALIIRLRGTTVNDSRTNSDGVPMEGTEITTNLVTEINHQERFATTASGTRYELGKIHPEYVVKVKENYPEGYAQMVAYGYVEADPATAN